MDMFKFSLKTKIILVQSDLKSLGKYLSLKIYKIFSVYCNHKFNAGLIKSLLKFFWIFLSLSSGPHNNYSYRWSALFYSMLDNTGIAQNSVIARWIFIDAIRSNLSGDFSHDDSDDRDYGNSHDPPITSTTISRVWEQQQRLLREILQHQARADRILDLRGESLDGRSFHRHRACQTQHRQY